MTSASKVPHHVAELFKDQAARSLGPDASTFWVLVHALQQFVESPENPQGLLPLSGALPDMKADTQRYVRMQTIYRQKAKDDLALFRREVSRALHTASLPEDAIAEGEIETFAKHAHVLKVLRGRSLAEEYQSPLNLGK